MAQFLSVHGPNRDGVVPVVGGGLKIQREGKEIKGRGMVGRVSPDEPTPPEGDPGPPLSEAEFDI